MKFALLLILLSTLRADGDKCIWASEYADKIGGRLETGDNAFVHAMNPIVIVTCRVEGYPDAAAYAQIDFCMVHGETRVVRNSIPSEGFHCKQNDRKP